MVLTVTAGATPMYFLTSGSDGEDPTTRQAPASGNEGPKPSLPSSPLLQKLGLPATGEPLDAPSLTAALSSVEATPENVPRDPGSILDLSAQEMGLSPAEVPEMRESSSLTAALSAYAHEIGEGPLTDEERRAIENVPAQVAPGLVKLVDAMTVATHLQKQATGDVSQEERAFLIANAPALVSGTADPDTRARADEISSRIDLSKSLAAAQVLLQAVEEARPMLEQATQQLEAQAEAAASEANDAANRADSQPFADNSPSRILEDTAEMLHQRAGTSAPAAAPPAVPLPEALERLTGVFGADVPEPTATKADRLPADLSKALGRIVAAYASTYEKAEPGDTSAPTSAESAGRILQAIEASRPVLHRWSWILQQAPGGMPPLTEAEANADAASFAQRATHQAASPASTIELAASRAGHDVSTPDWIGQGGLPGPNQAMNAWYDAFRPDVDASIRAEAVEGLENLPDDVQRATILLLWSQVQANRKAHEALPSAQQLDKLENLDTAMSAALSGGALPEKSVEILEQQVRLRDQVARGLLYEPGLILADATERVRELLPERSRNADDGDPSSPSPDAPGPSPSGPSNHDPLPGPHPDEPGSDDAPGGDGDPTEGPETPQPEAPPGSTSPGRDIWFADPTGTVVVTGFESTTHSPGHTSVLLDLGGDDVYRNNAGGAAPPQDRRYAVHVDLGGNDEYESTRPFVQAGVRGDVLDGPAGVLGATPVGLLVDDDGDDTYRGGPISQGSAFGGGLGLLADRAGDDSYVVEGEFKEGTTYNLAGGQGYAVQNIGDEEQAYLASTALFLEGEGDDLYQTPNGLGSSLVYYTEDALTAARSASGFTLEMGGEDRFECSGKICLGYGRKGNDIGLQSGSHASAGVESAEIGVRSSSLEGETAGIKTSTGAFADTSGEDTYKAERGGDSEVNPNSSLQVRASLEMSGTFHNQSLFLDAAVGDSDGDGYVDPVETTLGHEQGNASDNPHENLLREVAPQQLLAGPDADGDCWSDEAEERFGTDARDNASRPAAHPAPGCAAPSNDMIIDLSLDLTLGVGPTDPARAMELPGAVESLWNRLLSPSPPTPLGGGLGTDGTTVPILAIGDTTPTNVDKPYLVTLELGGDDHYEAPVGTARNPFGNSLPEALDQLRGSGDDDLPVALALSSVALDLQGDDEYDAPEDTLAFGAAEGGAFGVLVESAGDDRMSTDLGLGTALGPSSVGTLLDLDGDDQRTAGEFSHGYAMPSCKDLEVEFPGKQCIRQGSVAGSSVGLLVDGDGEDHTTGDQQGILHTTEDAGTFNSQNIPGAGESPDSARFVQDLAGYLDLAGRDTYVLTTPDAERNPYRYQGFAQAPPSGQDAGRARGAAVFADAEGGDRYAVRAENRSLVGISELKNGRILAWGLEGQEGAEQSPALFADTQGAEDLLSQPGAFLGASVDAASGANGRGEQRTSTFGGATGLQGRPPLLSVPRLDVYIGGLGDDLFESPARLAVDLDGDDTYLGRVGGAFGHAYDNDKPTTDVALGLDLGGNDVYRTSHTQAEGEEAQITGTGEVHHPVGRVATAGTQGAGILGVGIQADLGGENRFDATVDTDESDIDAFGVAQGAGYIGIGVLYTEQAKNRFETSVHSSLSTELAPSAATLAQGAGQNGIGLILTDAPEASDVYESRVEPDSSDRTTSSQGFGDSGVDIGLGILLDRGGADNYTATPSETSQGAGNGFLVDLGGRDSFNGERQRSPSAGESGGDAGRENSAGLRGCSSSPTPTLEIELPPGPPPFPRPPEDVPPQQEGWENYIQNELVPYFTDDPGPVGFVQEWILFGDESYIGNQLPAWVLDLPLDVSTGEGGFNRLICPAQDNADRVVTVLLDPSSHQIESLPAVDQELILGLEMTLHPTCDATGGFEDQVDNKPVIHDAACVRVELTGQASDQFRARDVTLWAESQNETGSPPAFVGFVRQLGDQAETVPWDATTSGLVDGNVSIRGVATIEPRDGGARELRPQFALRNEARAFVDTPPKVEADGHPRWVTSSELESGEVDPTFTINITSEANLTKPDICVDLVPQGEGLEPGEFCTGDSSEPYYFDPDHQIDFGDDADEDDPAYNLEVQLSDVESFDLANSALDTNVLYNVSIRVMDSHPVKDSEEFDADWKSQQGVATPAKGNAPTFAVDDTPPEGRIELANTQNLVSTSGGGFVVRWNATDPLGEPASATLCVEAPDASSGTSGDSCGEGWTPVQDAIDANPNGLTQYGDFDHGDTISFRLRTEDVAGNVNDNADSASTTVDLLPPRLSDPRVEPRFLQAGDPITFSVNVTEETSLGSTRVVVDGESYPLDTEATVERDSGDTLSVLGFDGWSQVAEDLVAEHGTNASRPEGYAYRFVVEDEAGNTAATSERAVFLDEIDPTVLNTTLEYPGGIAAAPGDLVRVTVEAADNFGVSRVTADVSALSSTDEVRLSNVPGTRNYTGTFVVEQDVDAPGADVAIHVGDRAGNEASTSELVRVRTAPALVQTLDVRDVHARNATLDWTTDAPSRAKVLLSAEGVLDEHRFTVDRTATEHALEMTGLLPSTTYNGTIVPLNEAGRSARSQTFTVETGSLIGIDVTSPSADSMLSGSVPVGWTATSPRSGSLVYTVSFESPLGSVPVASLAGEPGVVQETQVATHELPDGTYNVTVEAAQATDQNEAAVEDVLVDNTDPTVRLVYPKPGGAAPTGTVELEALVADEGAGVDPDTVRFLVDGTAHPPEAIRDGAATVTVDLGDEGLRQVSVEAADRVGNAESDGGPVTVDEDALDVVGARVGDGQAVQPGSQAPVHVELESSGQLSGTLDASAIGVDEPVELEQRQDVLHASLAIPSDASDGSHTLTADVRDDAGRGIELPLPVVVDGTEPALDAIEARSTDATVGRVSLTADEAVTVDVTLAAEGVPTVHASSPDTSRTPVVAVDDLRPGHAYDVTVEATDAAGNTASGTTTLETPADTQSPSQPGSPQAELLPDGGLVLEWPSARDEVGIREYKVYRSGPSGETELVGTTDDTRFEDGSARPGRAYRYTVAAVDLGGNEGPQSSQAQAMAKVAPQLSNGRVTPDKGDPDTTYRFEVTYGGPENPDPRVDVVLDGVPHAMERVDDGASCLDGCTLAYETRLPTTSYQSGFPEYRFQTVTDGYVAQYPADGSHRKGPLVLTSSEQANVPGGTAVWVAVGLAAVGGLGSLATWRWLSRRDAL